MSLFSPFQVIPGVGGAVFGDSDGSLLEARGGVSADAETVAALGAVISRHMANLCATMRRGPCEMVVIRTTSAARVLLFRQSGVAVLEVDPKRFSPDVESKLRGLDWSTKSSAPRVSVPPQTAKPPSVPSRATRDDGAARTRIINDSQAPGAPNAVPPAGRTPDTGESRSAAPSGPTDSARPAPVEVLKRKITGASPIVGRDAVFAGDLGTIGLPDVLEFCRNGQRTGTLVCRSGENTGTVKLRRGMIVLAVSPKSSAATLLARLLDSGQASEEQIQAVSQASEKGTDPAVIAQRLVASGFTDAQAVRDATVEQVQGAVDELLGWVDGRFAFHPGSVESSGSDTGVDVDPQVILLRIFKERDEKERGEATR